MRNREEIIEAIIEQVKWSAKIDTVKLVSMDYVKDVSGQILSDDEYNLASKTRAFRDALWSITGMIKERRKQNLKLSNEQFSALDIETRRSIMRQLMFIDTPTYQYCLGVKWRYWTMVRYEWKRDGEVDKETSTIVDEWL